MALVTGAGRNIGRAIALELAANGASVAVNVRANKEQADAVVKDIESAGGKALAIVADVGDRKAIEKMVAVTASHFGRIDFLINNAALRRENSLDQMTDEEWREVMAVTLDAPFYCVKSCLPHLKKSGAGAIVNIGGMSGHTGSKNRIHVVTAKAGLVGMTKALAHDLADDRVTVNLVVPGMVGTARPANFAEPHHHSLHHTLFGERGKSEDIAAIVCFLCGPRARYINGQTIHLNGGAYLG